MQLQPLPEAAAGPGPRAANPRLAFLRREQLRDGLLVAIESLERPDDELFANGFIADYIALRWLEWGGDRLRLTDAGAHVCNLLRIRQSPACTSTRGVESGRLACPSLDVHTAVMKGF